MALAPMAAPPTPQGGGSAHPIDPNTARQRDPRRAGQSRRWRLRWSLELVVACVATLASILAYVYWAHRGLILGYGDAISHMEIARRVWFSSTPGLAQLGDDWLPLDHILMLPFIWIDPLYRSGLAGALPSMLAYVVGCVGMAALGRTLFRSTWAGALGAVAYGANPNLLYLQATPLGESSMLAAAVLTALFLVRWIQTAARGGRYFSWRWQARVGAEDLDKNFALDEHVTAQSRHTITRHPTSPQAAKGNILSGLPEITPLILLALAAFAGTLVRYDGWAIALAAGLVVAVVAFLLWGPQEALARLLVFGFLGFAGCVGWLLYNWIIFGDPLDFYHGNYSSGYQQQIASRVGLPTKGNLLLSFRDYGQTVVDTIGWPVIIAALVGMLAAFIFLVAIPVVHVWRTRHGAGVVATSQFGEASSSQPSAWPLRSGLAWAATVIVLAVPFIFNWVSLYNGSAIVLTADVPMSGVWNTLKNPYLNDLYGVMLLPLFALGIAALAPIASEARRVLDQASAWRASVLQRIGSALHRGLVSGTIVVLLLAGVVISVAGTPYVLNDPLVGSSAAGTQSSITTATWLRTHYQGGRILASSSSFGGMIFYTNLPDDDFINQGTKPAFDDALLHPQTLATWIVFSTNSSTYDPVYDWLMTRGNTLWQADYTLAYRDGGIFIYERNI